MRRQGLLNVLSALVVACPGFIPDTAAAEVPPAFVLMLSRVPAPMTGW